MPADVAYEPTYEGGRVVRWSFERTDGEPLLIGGLWSEWVDRSSGELLPSFALLTVNVANHPLLKRLHAPDDEKRGLVMLSLAEVDRWPSVPTKEIVELVPPYPADALVMKPAPIERKSQSATA